MTNFLRNVAARALGSPGAVLPRIPSLYEPYRGNEGPIVARPGPGSLVADVEGQPGTEKDIQGAKAPKSRVALTQPLAAQAFDVETDAPVQPPARRPATDAITAPRASRMDEQPLSPIAMPSAEAPGSRNAARPVEAFPDQRDGNATSSTNQRISSPAEKSSEPAAVMWSRQEGAPVPFSAATRPVGEVVPPRLSHVDELRPASPAEANLAEPLRRASTVPAISAPAPSSVLHRAPAQALFPERRSLDARAAVQPPVAPMAGDTLERATSARPASPSRPTPPAVRPPVPAHVAIGNLVPTRPASSPSVPDIHVTIGTVEVRAVQAEKAAMRAPMKRPKMGLSLDEYLERSRPGGQ